MSHAATKRVFCIAFETFLDMVQWWLPKIPAGLHCLLFITTLKRGGTCAAHPPPPAGSPGVSDRRSQFSKSIPEKHSQDFRPRIHANLPSPYPFSFPPGPHRPPHDRKNQEEFFLLAFFSIFGSSKLHSKFCIEKIQKKVRKSRILASPNPPQTFPKCFQNRGPKKHAIFRRFVLDFFFFTLISWKLAFRLDGSTIFKVFAPTMFSQFSCIFGSKTIQKPFQNQVWSLEKWIPKTVCFFISIF